MNNLFSFVAALVLERNHSDFSNKMMETFFSEKCHTGFLDICQHFKTTCNVLLCSLLQQNDELITGKY